MAKKEQQTCSFGDHDTQNAFSAGLNVYADENINRGTALATNDEVEMLVTG